MCPNTENFVTCEQAVKLKELGFDWECNFWYHPKEGDNLYPSGMYNNHNTSKIGISAPTLSQAQKWLREVKQIYLFVDRAGGPNGMGYYWYITDSEGNSRKVSFSPFDSFEEALSSGIDKALELLKDNNNGK